MDVRGMPSGPASSSDSDREPSASRSPTFRDRESSERQSVSASVERVPNTTRAARWRVRGVQGGRPSEEFDTDSDTTPRNDAPGSVPRRSSVRSVGGPRKRKSPRYSESPPDDDGTGEVESYQFMPNGMQHFSEPVARAPPIIPVPPTAPHRVVGTLPVSKRIRAHDPVPREAQPPVVVLRNRNEPPLSLEPLLPLASEPLVASQPEAKAEPTVPRRTVLSSVPASIQMGGSIGEMLMRNDTFMAEKITTHVHSGYNSSMEPRVSQVEFVPYTQAEAGMTPLTPAQVVEKQQWIQRQVEIDRQAEQAYTLCPDDETAVSQNKLAIQERLQMMMQVPLDSLVPEALDYILHQWIQMFTATTAKTAEQIGNELFANVQTETEQMDKFKQIILWIKQLRECMMRKSMVPAPALRRSRRRRDGSGDSDGDNGSDSEHDDPPVEVKNGERDIRTKYDGAPENATFREVQQVREDRIDSLLASCKQIYCFRWVTKRSVDQFNLDLLSRQIGLLQEITDFTGQNSAERVKTDRKPSDFQILQKLVLALIKEQGCVRMKGRICEPIKNKDGQCTRAYRPIGEAGDIREFIEGCAEDEDMNPEIFHLMSNKPSFADLLEKRLTVFRSKRFPEAIRERNWHSFQNGMLDVALCKFMPYNSLEFRYLPPGKAACAYHDTKYDDLEYRYYLRNMKDNPLAFMDIPTPVDSICNVQDWPADERVWIFAEGGALLFSKKTATHPLKGHVSTHVGPGGLGKTTLLKSYSHFYHPFDIAQFKTKDEDVFGYERLPEAYIWMGYDIGKEWNIEHTFLYTLIDGGWLKINRKFKKAILYYVEQCGMLAMNEYLNLPDIGGAWSRRNLLHEWKNPPPAGGDRMMEDKSKMHIGAIMLKCILALRYLCITLQGKSVCRDTMPKTMTANLDRMRRDTNPLMGFFSSGLVVQDKERKYYIDTTTFAMAYTEWYKKLPNTNRVPPNLNSTTSHNVFAAHKCNILKATRPSVTNIALLVETDYIFGCTLQQYEANMKSIISDKLVESGLAILAEKEPAQVPGAAVPGGGNAAPAAPDVSNGVPPAAGQVSANQPPGVPSVSGQPPVGQPPIGQGPMDTSVDSSNLVRPPSAVSEPVQPRQMATHRLVASSNQSGGYQMVRGEPLIVVPSALQHRRPRYTATMDPRLSTIPPAIVPATPGSKPAHPALRMAKRMASLHPTPPQVS